MKIEKLKTYLITTRSVLATTISCCRCIIQQAIGRSTRPSVDKIIHQWVDKLFSLASIHYKVINPHNIVPEPHKATIIMCNHTSLYDIPFSFKAFPHHSIRMLAKKELASIPFLGRAMEASEFVFIDRKNRHQAVKDLATARELMESGILLWIFPEGTRSIDGKLAPFKKGGFITAIEAKATIIPIGIKGAFEILPAKSTTLNTNQTAEIHIGKPVDATDFTLNNKQALIDAVHSTMKDLLAN